MANGKRGQMHFTWIFSLIIGALIIFLAIFFASRYVQTSGQQTQAELAREFDVLLNPFASVGAITTATLSKGIELPSEMQINLSCNSAENYEDLNVRTRSGRGWSKWLPSGFKIRDKYVFAEQPLQGKALWGFSKPFEMPWRVDDVIYLVDKSYCFDSPPDHIRSEIESLKTNSIMVKSGAACPEGSVEVCFSGRGCAINVNYPSGIVQKEGQSILFSGDAMMYAAIFSDPALYKCNFDRLIARLRTQIDMNIVKATMLASRGCNTEALQNSLGLMKSAFAERLVGTFQSVANQASEVNPKECPVFD